MRLDKTICSRTIVCACLLTLVFRQGVLRADPPHAEMPFDGAQAKKHQEDWARHVKTEVEWANSIGMKLVLIPPGRFTMGSPQEENVRDDNEDQVQVTLSHSYWMGKHETTQGEWHKIMGTRPWREVKDGKIGDHYPATSVTWDDAREFCRKLTHRERQAGRLIAGWIYELPTEAQWEYACRAGTTTPFSFGSDDRNLGEYAWFEKNAFEAGEKYAHAVGQKKPNPWGLHDIHGNVWEWCRDRYADALPGGRDPEVTERGFLRVVRGGGWGLNHWFCRSAYRNWMSPDFELANLGFRVVLVRAHTVKPEP